ncbi:MAG: hypothetical protein P4L69_20175 [Desulfosporosinus sp.]|nr:hypothetical protein [Desulfosporosinus sp.]
MVIINLACVVYSVYVACDADLRKKNYQVEELSKEWTLEDAVNKYSEWEYLRGLVLGRDAVL